MVIRLPKYSITILINISILFIGILVGLSINPKNITNKPSFIIVEAPEIEMTDFHEIEIYILLTKYRVQNKFIVLSQAKLESGNFSSTIFLQNNNIVNMKVPSQRPTLARKSDLLYAYYKSIEHSVIDYAMWQCAYARNLTEDEYYSKLIEVGFAEDSLYTQKLKPIVKQLKSIYGK